MAWKKSSPPSAAPSTLSKILPLVVLFVVLAALAVVGFLVYSAVNNIASSANKQLEKKQILFGKDGVKVSVNHVEDEQYVDRTQRWVFLAPRWSRALPYAG